jgi:hypothetical protein
MTSTVEAVFMGGFRKSAVAHRFRIGQTYESIQTQEDLVRHAKFSKPLTVALPEAIYKRLKEVSDEKKLSMAEIVREILTKKLR